MNYITMICDIKNSRSLSNRDEIQTHLIQTIRRCNEIFQSEIACPFLITMGDEWEGLLKPNTNYTKVISFFQENLPKEVVFYTGIGIGDITVHNYELTVNQLDGPAFYLARDAITYAKEGNYRLVVLQNFF